MNTTPWKRYVTVIPAALLLMITLGCSNSPTPSGEIDNNEEAEAARGGGGVSQEVIAAAPSGAARAPDPPIAGFTPQFRLGFTGANSGDQWEPAIAADRSGHIYLLYAQYAGVPGCATCPSPSMILQISADHGVTWGAPHLIVSNPGTGQWDPQIVVDPVDGSTVYASWLQNNKGDTVVAKSIDHGVTWSVVVADHTNAGTDKPILTVKGKDVYVGFNHAQKVYVASSHNGGSSFTSVNVNANAKYGWSLAGGATIDTNNYVYFAWAGYAANGGATGKVTLYVSKSTDGGKTWTYSTLGTSGSPPDCSAFGCGWAFLGAQATLASDAAGTLYALWNAGTVDKGPEQIHFAKSTNRAKTWTETSNVSTAPITASHAFPVIVARGTGDVRISWMDTRAGGHWNNWYRSSTNGGSTWSPEVPLSSYVAGYDYIFTDGFSFPYGDYSEMDIDEQGVTHAVWGEGQSYNGHGSVWYSKGR